MIQTNKIFIDREAATGDFVMRMPADALPDFYEMLCASPLQPRRWFYQVKEQYFADVDYFRERSWGMSHDYKIAIEEGSTMVRIGTTIFGPRVY